MVWVRPWGPRPGQHPSPHLPLPSMYSRKSYVEGAGGPAEQRGRGSKLKREEAGGTEQAGTEAGPWVWLRGGPQLRLGYQRDLGRRVVTPGTGGTAASRRGS